MNKYYVLYKPFGFLSQFSDEGGNSGLGQIIDVTGVYAAGRLDKDSEGLLVLTDDGVLQQEISNPKHKWPKTYVVQVEGTPTKADAELLSSGVQLKDGKKRYDTLPAKAKLLEGENSPEFPERNPPVRFRKSIPTSWIEIKLIEGKNRQVRKMCAAVDFPCLGLIRVSIGLESSNDIIYDLKQALENE